MKIKRLRNIVHCEVPEKVSKEEPSHCYVIRKGKRVAKVWLNPVKFEPGHSLTADEIEIVEDLLLDFRFDFIEEYLRNARKSN